MKKTKSENKPRERVKSGKIEVLQWENCKDGESFRSFSISKTVKRLDAEDRSKFTGQVFSLNGLTKADLNNIKAAIDEMLDLDAEKECGGL